MNNKVNTFVAFNKVQICSHERLQLNLLHYFEDMTINFERVVEINSGVFVFLF